MKNIIIGFGTGRCGTGSLATILNNQPGCSVTHEKVKVGWELPISDPDASIQTMLDRPERVVGDVSYAWIRLLWYVFANYQNVKTVMMMRPYEEVVESFWEIKKDAVVCGKPTWYAYPFDSRTTTREDIERAVWKYKMLETGILQRHRFHTYPMQMVDLNDEDKLVKMLDWLDLGIPREEYVLSVAHDNTRKECLKRTIDPQRSNRPSFMDRLPDNMKLHPPKDAAED